MYKDPVFQAKIDRKLVTYPENSHYTVAWIKGSSVMFSSKIMRTSGWEENRR